MNDQELQKRFELCKVWQDPDQWDYLAMAYFQRGYVLNAAQCFRNADELRGCAFAEAVPQEVPA